MAHLVEERVLVIVQVHVTQHVKEQQRKRVEVQAVVLVVLLVEADAVIARHRALVRARAIALDPVMTNA